MAKKKTGDEQDAGKGPRRKIDMLLESNDMLRSTVAQIEKEFGTGSIMALGANSSLNIEGISTGCLSLSLIHI